MCLKISIIHNVGLFLLACAIRRKDSPALNRDDVRMLRRSAQRCSPDCPGSLDLHRFAVNIPGTCRQNKEAVVKETTLIVACLPFSHHPSVRAYIQTRLSCFAQKDCHHSQVRLHNSDYKRAVPEPKRSLPPQPTSTSGQVILSITI